MTQHSATTTTNAAGSPARQETSSLVAKRTANRKAGADDRALRIAILAPPWLAIPPTGYGGIETVVDVLISSLVERGHDVTLFAAPGSSCAGRTHVVLDAPQPDEIGAAQHEADHVAAALEAIESAPQPYDVIHDHCGHVGLAIADRTALAVVHTEHGPFDEAACAFYGRHGHRALIVCLSRTQAADAPSSANVFGAIPNPVDTSAWHPGGQRGDYVVWLGRFAETKGAHLAIRAARRAGVPLLLAGVVQPGQEEYFDAEIAPHVDGDQVRFVGEVGGEEKRELLAGARSLLMPITWAEPFGMVMVEALACGTPVIAFPRGAATEIVEHGRSGMLVDDERAMSRAIPAADLLDPSACRARALELCDPAVVAERYEAAYRAAIRGQRAAAAPGGSVPRSAGGGAALPAA